MLAGFTNKSAEAVCIYALMGLLPAATTDGNDSPAPSSANQQRRPILLFFSGIARGQIVEPRRANATSGWGWDPIFEEERSRLTFAEMSAEMKSKFSHRASALTILRKFLEI